jgi:hypothetical protein
MNNTNYIEIHEDHTILKRGPFKLKSPVAPDRDIDACIARAISEATKANALPLNVIDRREAKES